MPKKETVRKCYQAWLEWQATGNKSAACRNAGVGKSTLELLIKDYDINSADDWLPILTEFGIDPDYNPFTPSEKVPIPQPARQTANPEIVQDSINDAVKTIKTLKRAVDSLQWQLSDVVTPNMSMPVLGDVNPPDGGVAVAVAPSTSPGGSGDPFELVQKEIERAQKTLERAGMKVIPGSSPASVDEAKEMLEKMGYHIEDPRVSREELEKRIQEEIKRFKELHNEKIEVQLEEKRIQAAENIVGRAVDRIMGLFEPLISGWYKEQLQRPVQQQQEEDEPLITGNESIEEMMQKLEIPSEEEGSSSITSTENGEVPPPPPPEEEVK